MAEPIVFISHVKVREAKLDGLKQLSQEVTRRLEAEKPRTLVFLAFVDEDDTQVTFVHVFVDAESMDLHVQGTEERTRVAYEFVEPQGFEIYGRPSDQVLEMMRQAAASGVDLRVQSGFLGGFIRPTSG